MNCMVFELYLGNAVTLKIELYGVPTVAEGDWQHPCSTRSWVWFLVQHSGLKDPVLLQLWHRPRNSTCRRRAKKERKNWASPNILNLLKYMCSSCLFFFFFFFFATAYNGFDVGSQLSDQEVNPGRLSSENAES